MERAFVVLRTRGPAWDDSRPLEGQSEWTAHAEFMDGLFAEGFVSLVGPLEGTRDALLVVRASSESEFRRSTPWTTLSACSGLPWRASCSARWMRSRSDGRAGGDMDPPAIKSASQQETTP